MAPQIPSKISLKPKRHHGYSVVLFVMGTLFPPLAVAARFGIGKDFWLNLLLTICGYIPGHCHNFYIQNVRNNKNNRRTPKWAQRYGLVDTSEIERKKKKSQWAYRYNDRLPNSALEGQDYEEGEVPGRSREGTIDSQQSIGKPNGANQDGLWREEDEQYYGQNGDARSTRSGESGRWHYPANFEDTVAPVEGNGVGSKKKKKKEKKDRWARTEDAYSLPDESSGRKKKKKKSRSTIGDADSYDRRSEGPEDAEGGLYGDRYENGAVAQTSTAAGGQADELEHQF